MTLIGGGLLGRMALTLAQAGRAGRILAASLDHFLCAGPRLSLAQQRAMARLAATDPEDAVYLDIWSRAAHAHGASIEPVGSGFLRVRKGSRTTTVWRQETQLDDWVTCRMCGDKELTHSLLHREGLPVPRHVSFSARDLSPAHQLLGEEGQIVVKPAADTAMGQGVTGGVRTLSQLRRAAVNASRWDRRVLAEAHVPGDVIRILVLDSQVLDAVQREPPAVTGDGRRTAAELIGAGNDERTRAGGPLAISALRVDLDTLIALNSAGLQLRSVIDDGVTVPVKSLCSDNAMTDNHRVRISDALCDDAVRAAEALGVRLAGVDVITTDPERGLTEAGGAIIEVNATPGLRLHEFVRHGDPESPAAQSVLAALFDGVARSATG